MSKKSALNINYLFFLVFLLFSNIISTISIFEVNNTTTLSRSFFLIYAYSQCILEVAIFAYVADFIKKRKNLPKIVFNIYIGAIFFFFISHVIDLIIFKMMDLTFWEGLFLVLDENWENFVEMLHTTGIPFYAWIFFFSLAFIMPFLGVYLYKLTDKFSKKKRLKLNKKNYVSFLLVLPIIVLVLDLNTFTQINPTVYEKSSRSLPWKLTYAKPKILKTDEYLVLKKPKVEKKVLNILEKKDLKIDKKPNIFVFVIESLREDYITHETSPFINSIKEINNFYDKAVANANATHQSWFSLFYSDYSLKWKYYENSHWKSGSTSLNILKKMGYDINVFSSPELKYYSMKEALFGKNLHLCKNFKLYPHYPPIEACDSDLMVMDSMKTHLKEDSNVYIAFLDSTHFLYSWPKNFEAKFKPYAEVESFGAYTLKDSIDLLKNRYKNSINFVDYLIEKFCNHLKEKNLYDDAIIVILGDHGEEHYEQGHLFHASHLSCQQTRVPILLKLSQSDRKIYKRDLFCHMDVFPTIFDHLFGKNKFKRVLKGDSIFEKPRKDFVITTRYNGSRDPFEFFIHKKDEKLTLRFKKKKQIFKKQKLQILSLKDSLDTPKEIESKKDLLDSYKPAIDKLFD